MAASSQAGTVLQAGVRAEEEEPEIRLEDTAHDQPARRRSEFDVMMDMNVLQARVKELTEELEHARELASVQRKQATAAAEAMHTIKHHSHGEAPDTPSIRIQLNKKSGGGFGFGFSSVADGLRVESVEPRSPADKAGMLAGQVITRLMGRAASDIEHHAAATALKSVQWVILEIHPSKGWSEPAAVVAGASGGPVEKPPSTARRPLAQSPWKKMEYAVHFKTRVDKKTWAEKVLAPLDHGLGFEIAEDYDYTKSTNDNYNEPDIKQFYGNYTELRKHADYSYHSNYTEERQLWQDRVVKSVVYKTAAQVTPWVVYTAGPMGAGKGYALQWMSDNGFFPLENIVHIDPDHFKSVMPEWDGYTRQSTGSAGTLCHRESGYIQEIAQEVAMRAKQNIWVDGSLKDGGWFKTVFEDIRERFPEYKIAIFYVFADEAIIRARVKSREMKTGRGVPEAELVASMRAMNETLGTLVHCVDFIARINNNTNVPILSTFETVDSSGAWKKLENRFARTQPDPSEFPLSLSPLHLTPFTVPQGTFAWPEGLLEIVTSARRSYTHQVHFSEASLKREPFLSFQKFIKYPCVWVSPPYSVTLDGESRQDAGIPLNAQTFVYSAGVEDNECKLLHYKERKIAGLDEDGDHIAHFVLNGGFMYFDVNSKVCGLSCVRGIRAELAVKRGVHNIIQFGPGVTLYDASYVSVKQSLGNRLHGVSLAMMRKKNASKYGWVRPLETFGGLLANNPYGGFIYEFEPVAESDGHCRFFPVLGVDD